MASYGSNFERAAKLRARQAVREALSELGAAWKKYIRDSVSVDVEWVSGYGWVRSEPGEAPRRDVEGSNVAPRTLWKSFHYEVKRSASPTIENLRMWTTCMWASLLEGGTDYIDARPFWEPARVEMMKFYRSGFKSRVAENLRQSNQVAAEADFPANDDALPED